MKFSRIFSIALIPLAAAGTVQAQSAPCGERPLCPAGSDPFAERLHDAWNSGATTQAQRAKMSQIIATYSDGSTTDWANVAREYFRWRNGSAYTLPSKEPAQGGAVNYEQMQKIAENHVKQTLIDPESAIFYWRNGFKKNEQDSYVTCGYVNAKNRMGGFTGKSAFLISIRDMRVITYSSDEAGKPAIIDRGCRAASFPNPQAGMQSGTQTTTAAATSLPTAEERLKRLEALRASGAISQQEYEQQRKAIISSL